MAASVDQLSFNAIIEEISRNFATIRDVFALLGALYAAKCCIQSAYNLYRAVKVYVLPKLWPKQDFRTKYGEWAVVTGASEGIGRSYAIELAKRGMNIMLMSRSHAKLEKVAVEIESMYDVQTKIFPVDFNNHDCYERVESALSDLDIGVLVNNVGIMYDRLQYFLTVSSERLKQIVNLNIMTTVMMTRMILPQMVNRKRGAIINLSSGACVQPVPAMTAYSAAKIYTDYFSRALGYEYYKDGVVIQSVQPFYVSTRMTNFMKPNFLVPDADTYVDHALKTLPFTTRTFGYWSHGLMGFFGNLIPEWLFFWSTININVPIWNFFVPERSDEQSKKVD